MNQYRQGHILLNPVGIPSGDHILLNPVGIPSGAVKVVPPIPGHVVIATGETGREHGFKSERINIFQDGAQMFIEILGDEPIWLEHPEHDDIEIDPGTYLVVDQREDDSGMGFGQQRERRSYD